jgi:hypothetical protein
VEIVRQAWAAWVRKDNKTGLALYDPEVQIDLTAVPHIGQSGSISGAEASRSGSGTCSPVSGSLKTEVENGSTPESR